MERQVHQLVRWSRLVAKSLVSKPCCWGQIPILLFSGSVTLDKEVNLSVPCFLICRTGPLTALSSEGLLRNKSVTSQHFVHISPESETVFNAHFPNEETEGGDLICLGHGVEAPILITLSCGLKPLLVLSLCGT